MGGMYPWFGCCDWNKENMFAFREPRPFRWQQAMQHSGNRHLVHHSAPSRFTKIISRVLERNGIPGAVAGFGNWRQRCRCCCR